MITEKLKENGLTFAAVGVRVDHVISHLYACQPDLGSTYWAHKAAIQLIHDRIYFYPDINNYDNTRVK